MRKYGVLGIPLVPPIISNFTQNPDPICRSTSGFVYVNLSQYTGTETYAWYSDNEPSYIQTDFQGDRCKVTYLTTDVVEIGDGPTWSFGCTVTNPAGSSTLSYTPNLDPDCYGCPTLSFKVDGEMIDENPLLITSLSNPGTDVTDYYLINTEIEPEGDEINFTINEPQTEHTWMDQVELIETKVNKNEYVAVTADGEIVNYRKPPIPFTITLNDTLDVTDILSDLDSIKLQIMTGDLLRVEINNHSMGGGEGDNLILGGEEIWPPRKRPIGNLRFVSGSKKETDLKGNENSKVENFGNFYFRPNMSIICKSLKLIENGYLEILLTQDVELDYLTIVKNLKTARTKTLDMISAVHSTTGDVKELLSSLDQNYAEIYPGESIDFIFESGPGNPDKKAYILKSVGSYETDSSFIMLKGKNLTGTGNEIIIPKENKLFDNYPNPFNPVTQIKYSIKEDSPVSLKVYDILGNEVAVLVNKEQPAGNYTVEFDAGKIASGIYLYSISSKDFYKVKKMIVLK